MKKVFLLLQFVYAALAVTHVNISIAEHPVAPSVDGLYIGGQAHAYKNEHEKDTAQIQNRTLQNEALYVKQSAQLRANEGNDESEYFRRLDNDRRSARLDMALRHSATQGNPITFDIPGHQRIAELKEAKERNIQNNEFERYIENYHSGPTVETVYESPQRYRSTPGSSSPQLMAPMGLNPMQPQFERQVALPVLPTEAHLTKDRERQIQFSDNHKSVLNSDPSLTSIGNSGYDQFNFDSSRKYSGRDDENINYNYDDIQQPDLSGTAVVLDEFHDKHDVATKSYEPEAPPRSIYQSRPTVTKTIQIAQPALKAKKYEVRHPAIQKEFYDIEERVLIKPAGTIVVELERPVAKIPKGETILPLGHPHPAVAGAYNLPQQTYADGPGARGSGGNFESFSYSSVTPQAKDEVQYNPVPVYTAQNTGTVGTTTIGSTITTTPTYDQSRKDEFIDANLNRQFNRPDHNHKQEQSYADSTYLITDTEGNQHRIPSKHVTPNMLKRDDSDFVVGVQTKPNSYATTRNVNTGDQTDSRHIRVQGNYNNNHKHAKQYNDLHFDGVASIQPDAKLARLQTSRPMERKDIDYYYPTLVHSLKEHRQQLHSSQVEEEQPAHIAEVRSNLNHHRGPVLVYGANIAKNLPSERQSQTAHNTERVYYSAPYSQMRYLPHEPTHNVDENYKKLAKLEESRPTAANDVNNGPHQSNLPPYTHIGIQIPHHPHEANMPIVISSTIRPIMNQEVNHGMADHHGAKYEPNISNQSGELHNSQTVANFKSVRDCDQDISAIKEEKFSRLVETPNTGNNEQQRREQSVSSSVETENQVNIDATINGATGHITPQGSRVIAATPAPIDASAHRESFHKRRIVVNHPFQTVREMVEHEPITNYHDIQITEPASPALYHNNAPYIQHESTQHSQRQLDTAFPVNAHYATSHVAPVLTHPHYS